MNEPISTPTTPLAGHHLVGVRRPQLGRLPAERLAELWVRVSSRIVKHGFVIELRDLEPPRTGIFDGLRIVIDPDVPFEMQCFVLLHLFGHSVQWVAPSLSPQLDALQNTSDMTRFMRVLHDYEFQAARFGMTVLHDVAILDCDDWYSDFVETDWRYVEGYYRTNEIPRWEDCIATAPQRVEPLAIPELKHRQVEVRYAF